MLFEIQVLAWDGHKNVIGLNWLTRSQFLSCCEHMFFHLFLVISCDNNIISILMAKITDHLDLTWHVLLGCSLKLDIGLFFLITALHVC
jgi:hypothetical protein